MIELRSISKAYGDRVIFDHFDLYIEAGEMTAIIGESGSGKSTVLNIVGGLEKADQGEVVIQNKLVTYRSFQKLRKNTIGYLFQNYALIEHETVMYNLMLALKDRRIKRQEKMERVLASLKAVGMDEYLEMKVYQLSGGEQQRIAVARLILQDPEIILCDEPTGSLDEKNKKRIMNMLIGFKKQGKTILIVTHDLEVAKQCSKVVNLSE